MSDDTEVAALSHQIKTLSVSVERLINANERLITQFERVGILEEKHTHHDASIGRAFKELGKLRDDFILHEKDTRAWAEGLLATNEKDHKFFNKALWIAVGFCTATTVFWSVFGYHIERVVDEQARAIGEARMHVYEDKIKSSDDVRAVLKENGSR